MKRFALFAGILALAAPLAVAQTSTWAIDPAHSGIEFSIRHMGISNVHGHFGNVQGNVLMNDADATKSTVQVNIDTTTLDTGESPRDTHLKSPDFFEVTKYPTATFTSTGVAKNGNHLAVTGNLTLHGVTRPVQLDVDGPSAPVPGMDKKPHSGFSATTTISRKDYGIGPKFPDAMVGDEVKLTIELEVIKQ
jgi:polyisoprenoid-binding protein YceI